MAEAKKHVLITGVSSGIGLGLAEEYLARGWQVFGLSRRVPENLTDHPGFHFKSLDLTDEQRTRDVLPLLLNGVGSLDLAILNAGILGRFGDMHEMSLADVKQVMEVNVWSVKSTLDVLYALPIQIDSVITMSSGAAVNGNRGWAGYSVSKAALNMLTKLYAVERPETYFCALAPGLVDTPIQDILNARSPDERYPAIEVIRSKRDTIEMPKPEQVAPRLADCIEKLPDLIASGEFADIRQLPG